MPGDDLWEELDKTLKPSWTFTATHSKGGWEATAIRSDARYPKRNNTIRASGSTIREAAERLLEKLKPERARDGFESFKNPPP